MANPEQLKTLRHSVEAWNKWREENRDEWPDLHEAGLRRVFLGGADLTWANLIDADLSEAYLNGANLTWASLSGANLVGAKLSGAYLGKAGLIRADLTWAILSGAILREASLSGAKLFRADLSGADLRGAILSGTDLMRADLSGADLEGADLSNANLVETVLTNGANLTGCRIYGVSAWRPQVNETTRQNDLVITRHDEPVVTVDNLEVAQFVYLLLRHPKIRDVISTIGNKGVLILGRFTDDRKSILDALRVALRHRGYVPMVFDFEGAEERDLTETVLTLAGMSKFVIADITSPRSVPHELAVVLPNYMIPFKPILQKGEKPYAMFADYRKRFEKWVLPRLEYRDEAQLVAVLEDAIIHQVEEKHKQLLIDKAREDVAEDADDYEYE